MANKQTQEKVTIRSTFMSSNQVGAEQHVKSRQQASYGEDEDCLVLQRAFSVWRWSASENSVFNSVVDGRLVGTHSSRQKTII
uniref:Uncharacterized protein n=1 Tax=Glossina morsitans morsitans TaxID=37546 RepID=A0A1B0GCJ6_GLOMM